MMNHRPSDMFDEYGFELYEDNEFPLAYLITFRTYGTWLHGDERYSINRSNRGVQGTVKLAPNVPLNQKMQQEMKQPPTILDTFQRTAVDHAVRELCIAREYVLHALNVRSVVRAAAKPERIADAMKAFATKRLRELGLIESTTRLWARGRSRRYLWKPRHVEAAISYVLYSQGDSPFEIEDQIH